ncbi:MAG: hypothetical protein R3F37_23230 [Candidatus Competibacteraceae bacterium]
MLELLDGTTIPCSVPHDVARELGHRLYEMGTFTGMATWNTVTLALEEFSVSGFAAFPGRKPSEAFSSLHQLIGPELEQISDVDAFVTGLRQDEDEE